MPVAAEMTTSVEVWARTAESDSWTCKAREVALKVTELTLQGRRQTSELLDPSITHIARAPLLWEDYLVEGRRLRAVDGAEYVIGQTRVNRAPSPGHVRCYLAEAESVIG